jgi:Zinc finger, C2H2 type
MSATSSSASDSSAENPRRSLAPPTRVRRFARPKSPASTASSRDVSPSPPPPYNNPAAAAASAAPARPVRKQSLSFILNAAASSHDQQQFADALQQLPAATACRRHGTAAGAVSSCPASCQQPALAASGAQQVAGKRSAEQAGLHVQQQQQQHAVTAWVNGAASGVGSLGDHDSFVSDGSDRKRRRRRASVPCELCGRVFGEAAALRKHCRVVHEKKKDFTCEDCGRAFAEKSNLKKHAQARHGAAARPHPCPDCTKVFSFSDGLRRHINNCHLGLRPYNCPVEGCAHAFKQRTHLQKHQQSVHGIVVLSSTDA